MGDRCGKSDIGDMGREGSLGVRILKGDRFNFSRKLPPAMHSGLCRDIAMFNHLAITQEELKLYTSTSIRWWLGGAWDGMGRFGAVWGGMGTSVKGVMGANGANGVVLRALSVVC